MCATMILGVFALSACSSNTAANQQEVTNAVATTVTSTPPPATSSTPPATTVVAAAGLKGEADIADNFDVQATLPADATPVLPEADAVGAFRFECLSGQLAKDDPIVYPGQPGKSHLHQFFGNTLTNASSTYQSLRTSGGSTCTGQPGNTDPTSQRSAYWMPAMLDGAGNVVKPNRMLTYYKRIPGGAVDCGPPDNTHVGYCVPIPNGIRIITGYNMATGAGGPADLNSIDQWTMGYDCWSPSGPLLSAQSLHTLAAVVASGTCPAGSQLRVRIDFPTCWDGKNLDSPDHRSHVVFSTVNALTPSGARPCPADHPYVIPQITMQAFFTVDANFVAGRWSLSSDAMLPGAAAGTTLHADYWEAWSPLVKNIWETSCINAHMSCSNGQLGNGQKVKGMDSLGAFPNHVLVSLSSIP
jgi:hypothetical protein